MRMRINRSKGTQERKLRKIFYPMVRLRDEIKQKQTASLDYAELIERDLYGRKERRTNSIFKSIAAFPSRNVSSVEECTLPQIQSVAGPTVSFRSEEVSIDYKSRLRERHKQIQSVTLQSHEAPTNKVIVLTDSILEDELSNNKSRSELSQCCGTTGTQPEIVVRNGRVDCENQAGERLERVESLLRHMLRRHEPIVSQKRREINNSYKRGVRESYNLNMRSDCKDIQAGKQRDEYLSSQIREQKDRYLEDIQQKLFQIGLDPASSPSLMKRRQLQTKKCRISGSSSRGSFALAEVQCPQTVPGPRISVKQLQDEVLALEAGRLQLSGPDPARPRGGVKNPVVWKRYGHLKAALAKAPAMVVRRRVAPGIHSEKELLPREEWISRSIDRLESRVATMQSEEGEGEEKTGKGARHKYQTIKGLMKDIDEKQRVVQGQVERMHLLLRRIGKEEEE